MIEPGARRVNVARSARRSFVARLELHPPGAWSKPIVLSAAPPVAVDCQRFFIAAGAVVPAFIAWMTLRLDGEQTAQAVDNIGQRAGLSGGWRGVSFGRTALEIPAPPVSAIGYLGAVVFTIASVMRFADIRSPRA